MARFTEPFQRAKGESPFPLRDAIKEVNWNKVGIVRNGPDLESALETIETIRGQTRGIRIGGPPAYNMPWNVYLDLMSMIDVSGMVIASALARKESRAAHYRSDYPEQDDANGPYNIFLTRGEDGQPQLATKPVAFTYKSLKECQQYRK